MNIWAYLGLLANVLGALAGVQTQIQAGEQIEAPGIRTYLFGKHVELDVVIKPLP